MSDLWSAEQAPARRALPRPSSDHPAGHGRHHSSATSSTFLAMGRSNPDGNAQLTSMAIPSPSSKAGMLAHPTRIGQFPHVQVVITATPAFTEHATVADATSELLGAMFGCLMAPMPAGYSSSPFDIPISVLLSARLLG